MKNEYKYSFSNSRRGFLFKDLDAVNVAIAFFLVYTSVYTTFSGINDTFKTIALFGNYVFLLLFVNAMPCIAKSISVNVLTISIVYIYVLLFSYIFSNYTDIYSVSATGLLRDCIPAFFLAISIRDTDDLSKKIQVISVIILILQFISITVLHTSSAVVNAYSQTTGYQTLIPFSVFFYHASKKGNRLSTAGTLISLVIIVMSGARGPLLCAFIGALLIVYENVRENPKRLLTYIVIILLVFVPLYFYYSILLNWVTGLFDTLGVSTRIVNGLTNLDLAEDVMRSRLRRFGTDYSLNHFLVGCGVLNDRYLIYSNVVDATNSTVFGSYVHNFFVEILMQFGFVPGLFILLIFLNNLRKTFISAETTNDKEVLYVFFIIGFLPLLVSRSYFTFAEFYLFAGLIINRKMIFQYNR